MFYIGGINTQTYEQVNTVEVYNEEEESWEEYMDLPSDAGVDFPSSPDSGCPVALPDRILSVGTNKMISLSWSSGAVQTVAEWEEPLR